jgi:gamma-glutamyltranspeptidase / glutathione hydrolase
MSLNDTPSARARPASWDNPHPSRRTPTLGSAVVVAAQPLAAQAGLAMLAQGGSAADAAIAAAAVLTVVEPVSSSLGADAFALVAHQGQVLALNGSGRSPAVLMPAAAGGGLSSLGWPGVTVPGAVAAWTALSQRLGRLPFATLMAPAIGYAEEGFLVSPLVSRVWRGLAAMYRAFPELMQLYFVKGRGPEPGARVRLPALGRSLRLLAASQGQDLYQGELAERIARHAREQGATLNAADLAAHRSAWVSPLSLRYGGHELHEMPPNSQGLAALMALGMLEHLGLQDGDMAAADVVHLQVEATRLALAEVHAHVADPGCMRVDVQSLLDPQHLARLASGIDRSRASAPQAAGIARPGGTSYLTAADAQGMVVSYIQSSGPGFGSGIVVPGTGIALQNRGAAFNAEAGHPNAAAPGKLPFHTNCPALLTRDGRPVLSFGLMGWSMQPQAHVQFVCRALHEGASPQAIVDAPRWRVAAEEHAILLEPGLQERVGAELAARGHHIVQTERFIAAATPFGSQLMFGGAALIRVLDDGYAGAADPRRDGAAVAL